MYIYLKIYTHTCTHTKLKFAMLYIYTSIYTLDHFLFRDGFHHLIIIECCNCLDQKNMKTEQKHLVK